MPYTLSSPTVLAVDAACRPRGLEVLRTVADVFRLTSADATHLGLHALDADGAATGRAWLAAEDADAAVPLTQDVVLSAAHGRLPAATALARSGLGGAADVVRLVVREAAAWPQAPGRWVLGGGVVPLPAAAAAGAVVAAWLHPHLDGTDAAVLRAPWEHLRSARPAGATGMPHLRAPGTPAPLEALAEVRWPPGVWARAMHTAAWAAHTTGRLRDQLLVVMDATAAALEREPAAEPVLLRTALPALHGLAVADLLEDVLDDGTLGELRLGATAA